MSGVHAPKPGWSQAVSQRCDANSVCAGFGPQKLATLAAYALRRNLLDWLETFKVEKLCAERLAKQREASKVNSLCADLLPVTLIMLFKSEVC